MLRPLTLWLCSAQVIIEKNPYLSALMPSVGFDSLQVNYVDFERIETDFVFAIDNPTRLTTRHFSMILASLRHSGWLVRMKTGCCSIPLERAPLHCPQTLCSQSSMI